MKLAQTVLAIVPLVLGLSAGTASAAEIPTSYVVDAKALKKNAPAGTTLTFSLYSDPTCSTLIASEIVNVEDVLLREQIKPLKIAGDTNSAKPLVELRHTFTASPAGGTDLYVSATASVAAAIDTSTTLLGACQTQSPTWGSAAPAGTIIPFASGLPVNMTTLFGSPSNVAISGFGNSASVPLTAGQIDLTGSPGSEVNFAFSMPSDGVITAISGFFSSTTAPALIGTTITLSASLYCSPTPDNIFTSLPGANVVLAPGLTGLVPIGTISSGLSSGLNIPVTAGTRCLMTYSASASGLALANTIDGYVSGGVTVQ